MGKANWVRNCWYDRSYQREHKWYSCTLQGSWTLKVTNGCPKGSDYLSIKLKDEQDMTKWREHVPDKGNSTQEGSGLRRGRAGIPVWLGKINWDKWGITMAKVGRAQILDDTWVLMRFLNLIPSKNLGNAMVWPDLHSSQSFWLLSCEKNGLERGKSGWEKIRWTGGIQTRRWGLEGENGSRDTGRWPIERCLENRSQRI